MEKLVTAVEKLVATTSGVAVLQALKTSAGRLTSEEVSRPIHTVDLKSGEQSSSSEVKVLDDISSGDEDDEMTEAEKLNPLLQVDEAGSQSAVESPSAATIEQAGWKLIGREQKRPAKPTSRSADSEERTLQLFNTF
eukprot:GHVP01019253.1.p1 GENE.GHVP01019253.1~~GHVP01019253.1.p1  ORF type:complete len:137 (+),score=20.97 GHVP01019253.1:170-580(+)